MMNPVLATRLRRQWPMFSAFVVTAIFLLVHMVVFQPLAQRYRTALAEAAKLGLMLDPAHPAGRPALPPRVFSLLASNSLTAHDADAGIQSGSLTADMVQSLSTLTAKHGLEIVVADPGQPTQQANSIELRAHLRLRGHYADFVALLDDLARGGSLWMIERFSMVPGADGRVEIEAWFARCLLRRTGGTS